MLITVVSGTMKCMGSIAFGSFTSSSLHPVVLGALWPRFSKRRLVAGTNWLSYIPRADRTNTSYRAFRYLSNRDVSPFSD